MAPRPLHECIAARLLWTLRRQLKCLFRLLEHGRNKVGFPLLVKAVLGGGGKGMKLATSAADLEVHRGSYRMS